MTTPADPVAALVRLDGPVIHFPVRHHSPTAARLVRSLIAERRPSAVLVEGPSDFNDRLAELALPHRLPIAIYSYVRQPDGRHRSAYYPFCEHSPEWQAIRAANECGIPARFIDLPWADMVAADADDAEPTNRYADGLLARGRYIDAIRQRLGVEDMDAVWDTLAELDPDLSLTDYLTRTHAFCTHIRLMEGEVAPSYRRREAFMAARVADALAEFGPPVLVVAGGYHSVGIAEGIGDRGQGVGEDRREEAKSAGAPPSSLSPDPYPLSPPRPLTPASGIALTPYSFERLDSLAGYNAGMPNPGFYDRLWHDRLAGRADTHRGILARVAEVLRERQQPVSSADLIAVEATASALAALRGHPRVWRTDLIDGIIGSLIKDDRLPGGRHPLLDAVHEVLRGGERGRLAEGTLLPPLVADVRHELHLHDLEPPEKTERIVDLDLETVADGPRSRVLHRLRLLGVAGFTLASGTDWMSGEAGTRLAERWKLLWSPDFESGVIESARYGPTLSEAATAAVVERIADGLTGAEPAAALLIDAALAGLTTLAADLFERLTALVRADADFFAVTKVLGRLLYLYRYDAVLAIQGQAGLGGLLRETHERGLWLLETLGQVSGRDAELLAGVRALVDVFARCGAALGLDRDALVGVLSRVEGDRGHLPVLRGAAVGARWMLGALDAEQVHRDLLHFRDPERLGDFLTGLVALAREAVQRHPELLTRLDSLLRGYGDDDFLAALPSLRLAFTYFTPREKHQIGVSLREAFGLEDLAPPAELEVSPESAATMLAFEGRLFAELARYGLRGG